MPVQQRSADTVAELGKCWPLIISAGLNGSGSTWMFNLISTILRRHDPGARIRTVYSEQFLDEIVADGVDTTIVKTHMPPAVVRSVARAAGIPIFLTVRDPKDGVASLMTRFAMDFEQALDGVRRSADALAPLVEASGVLTLRYEDRFTSRRGTVNAVAGHLGLEISPADRDAAWRRLTRGAVQAKIRDLAAKGVFAPGSSAAVFDPDTHWHPGHVGEGRIGGWRRALSMEEAVQVDRSTTAFRDAFGYEAAESSPELAARRAGTSSRPF
jgi:hypothetical protein